MMARKLIPPVRELETLTTLQWSRANDGAETEKRAGKARPENALQWSRANDGAETQNRVAAGDTRRVASMEPRQ